MDQQQTILMDELVDQVKGNSDLSAKFLEQKIFALLDNLGENDSVINPQPNSAVDINDLRRMALHLLDSLFQEQKDIQ